MHEIPRVKKTKIQSYYHMYIGGYSIRTQKKEGQALLFFIITSCLRL